MSASSSTNQMPRKWDGDICKRLFSDIETQLKHGTNDAKIYGADLLQRVFISSPMLKYLDTIKQFPQNVDTIFVSIVKELFKIMSDGPQINQVNSQCSYALYVIMESYDMEYILEMFDDKLHILSSVAKSIIAVYEDSKGSKDLILVAIRSFINICPEVACVLLSQNCINRLTSCIRNSFGQGGNAIYLMHAIGTGILRMDPTNRLKFEYLLQCDASGTVQLLIHHMNLFSQFNDSILHEKFKVSVSSATLIIALIATFQSMTTKNYDMLPISLAPALMSVLKMMDDAVLYKNIVIALRCIVTLCSNILCKAFVDSGAFEVVIAGVHSEKYSIDVLHKMIPYKVKVTNDNVSSICDKFLSLLRENSSSAQDDENAKTTLQKAVIKCSEVVVLCLGLMYKDNPMQAKIDHENFARGLKDFIVKHPTKDKSREACMSILSIMGIQVNHAGLESHEVDELVNSLLEGPVQLQGNPKTKSRKNKKKTRNTSTPILTTSVEMTQGILTTSEMTQGILTTSEEMTQGILTTFEMTPGCSDTLAEMTPGMLTSEETPSKEDDEEDCVVCIDRAPSIMFAPCGHMCVCRACLEKNVITTCPICRSFISGTVDLVVQSHVINKLKMLKV